MLWLVSVLLARFFLFLSSFPSFVLSFFLSLSLSRGLTCRLRPLAFSRRLDDAPHTPPPPPLEPRCLVISCAGYVRFWAFLVLFGKRSSSFCFFFFFFFFFSFLCFSRRDTDQVTGHTHPHTHDGRGGGGLLVPVHPLPLCFRMVLFFLFSPFCVMLPLPLPFRLILS